MRNDFNCFLASSKGHHQLKSCLRCGIFIRTNDGVWQPTHGDTNLYYLLLFQSWQKTIANSIPTETAWSSKATLQDKSKQKKERGIGVVTGASDVVSEVHYPNKSNSIMQQNANKNVKCNDNDNTKSHPNTKKCAPNVATSTPQVSQLKSHDVLNVKNYNTKSNPNTKKRLLSVATSTPQVSQLKSPDALNVKRQLKFQGNSVTNPYLNTKPKVASFKSPAKMTTIQVSSSIATPPMKVSPLNSPEKTIRTQTHYSQTKTELRSEPASNKLNAFEIDWINENVTTAEAMKYPHFTKIKRTK